MPMGRKKIIFNGVALSCARNQILGSFPILPRKAG
jgi:hypothetical protein